MDKTTTPAPGWQLAIVLCAFALTAVIAKGFDSSPYFTTATFGILSHLTLLLLVSSRVSLRPFPKGFGIMRDLLLGTGAASFAWFASGYALRFTTSKPYQPPNSPAEIALYVIVSVLIAPVSEELIFRGYMQEQIAMRTASQTIAVTLQAILFGAIHLRYGLPYMLIIAVTAGLPLGILAFARKSLWPGIIAHTVFNAATLVTK